jgi:hypothetical protein
VSPAPANVLVVRTSGGAASLDEYLTTTASQTGPQQSLVVPSCQLQTGVDQAYGGLTYNGEYGLWPCGEASNTARVIARVSPAGVVDTRTGWTTGEG